MRLNWGLIVALILCTMFWVVVITAIAKAETPNPKHVARAMATAQRVWHPPCMLTSSVERGEGYTKDAAGWAHWRSCHLTINSERQWEGYPDLCTIILHEAGHASGWQNPNIPDDPLTLKHEGAHSGNPRSVMYPTSFFVHARSGNTHVWDGVDRRCLYPSRPSRSSSRAMVGSNRQHKGESHGRSAILD